MGRYYYTVNFTDDNGNSIVESVAFAVNSDMTHPVITVSPNDFTAEPGYAGQSLSWTATDANPDTYTIELLGSGLVKGPSPWTSGSTINYNIPNGFSHGVYGFLITFKDKSGNGISDSVWFTVGESTNPNILKAPVNLTLEFGYTGQSLLWMASDTYPDTYTIELLGTGIVAGPTAWTSGGNVIYNIPDGLTSGVYTYNITFLDQSGNSVSDTVTVTITPEEIIPFGNFFLIFIGLSVIYLIYAKKRKIVSKPR